MNDSRHTGHSPRRILIVKPSSLGDIVHALPTLTALRETFPSAQIHWLVKEQWAALLERVEGLSKVWPIRPGLRGWLSIFPVLRSAGFDCVVDLQGLFRSGAVAWLTGAERRVGFQNAREGSPVFYTDRITIPTLDMHAVDRYLLLAEALGAKVASRGVLAFGLKSRPEDRQAVADLLQQHGLSSRERWIAVNPAARWPTKCWPVESFAVAADRLQEEAAGRVVLIGGPEDRQTAQQVAGLMSRAPVDLTGKTPVGLLPALLESAAVVLTNDSGPMHIAAAVGTPVVALFGPTSALRTGPYGRGHIVLQQKLPCSPCFSRTCRNRVELECLRNISTDRAVAAVQDRLAS
jgi:heptosyltransferase-1